MRARSEHFGLSVASAATIRRAHAIQPVIAIDSGSSLWTRALAARAKAVDEASPSRASGNWSGWSRTSVRRRSNSRPPTCVRSRAVSRIKVHGARLSEEHMQLIDR